MRRYPTPFAKIESKIQSNLSFKTITTSPPINAKICSCCLWTGQKTSNRSDFSFLFQNQSARKAPLRLLLKRTWRLNCSVPKWRECKSFLEPTSWTSVPYNFSWQLSPTQKKTQATAPGPKGLAGHSTTENLSRLQSDLSRKFPSHENRNYLDVC